MLKLNGGNFISENISLFSILFSMKGFFFVSHTTAKKKENKKKKNNNCHGNCCIIRYFRLQRRMPCQSITKFTGSRMFAGMNNEKPGLLYNILIHVKWIYQRQSYQIVNDKLSKIWFKGLPSKADFTIFLVGGSWKKSKSRFCPKYPSFDRQYN